MSFSFALCVERFFVPFFFSMLKLTGSFYPFLQDVTDPTFKSIRSHLKPTCDPKSKKIETQKKLQESKYLEKAHFQHFGGKYWSSPFGRYENFKKVILREGLRKYKPYLDGKKLFYIRVLRSVPAQEVHYK